MYTLELEKLTEEQLEAFKIIDKKAVEAEVKRRAESTYTSEDMKVGKVYADLYKAYFYLKPMYDNMRNTDVKKTITQSEVLTVIEKVIKWADKNGVNYEKFKGDSLVAEIAVPLTVGEPEVRVVQPEEQHVTKVFTNIGSGTATVEQVAEPVWEPGGGAEVEQPEFIQTTEPVQVAEIAPEPKVEEKLSPVEAMSQEKLNEILASIPAVEKI